MNRNSAHSLLFLKSVLSDRRPLHSDADVLAWLELQKEKVRVSISRIPFAGLKAWRFDDSTGALRHDSGKFFSVDGIRVHTNWDTVNEWEQPIINQPEIGYLGFVVREFDGVLHFLAQAKIEPGNINYVQLSPTLQATKSNYTCVHKGKIPAYLEYFRHVVPNQVMVDQLQSEQGARFLKKRNRNFIVKVDEDIPLLDNFIWVTLNQLKAFMRLDNVVNMDSRTVVSNIPYGEYAGDVASLLSFVTAGRDANSINAKLLGSILSKSGALHDFDHIIKFITGLKSVLELDVENVRLRDLRHWSVGPDAIEHDERKYFRVIAVEVEIDNRETVSWTQPMVEPAQEGLCAFVCKEINGLLHFAVQAKLECGNFDVIEFAPTVQCLTGNYRAHLPNSRLPFLDYVLGAGKGQILFDTMQSEEGGRFYREQNRNMVVLAGDGVPVALPANYIWMTLNQIHAFIRFNNYINIQARSLIAALSLKAAEPEGTCGK